MIFDLCIGAQLWPLGRLPLPVYSTTCLGHRTAGGADSEWCISTRLTVAEHDQKTGESTISILSQT